jgi:hypothetical protein
MVPLSFDPIAELLPRRIFVLVREGREFRVPYTPEVWKALEADGEYPEGFFILLARLMEALRSEVWPAGSYFPGGWFRALVARGEPADKAIPTPAALAAFFGEEVRVSPAGVWTVGSKVITGAVLRFFLRNLHFDAVLMRYVIRYALDTHMETRYLHHESLPLRILALEPRAGGLWVHANDGTVELLRWETLRLDAQERLYCAIRPERLPAEFASGPRFRLLDRLEEQAGLWRSPDSPGSAPLNLEAPWPGAGSLDALPPA